MNEVKAIRGRRYMDRNVVDIIRKISLNRLIVGGAAILAADIRNHNRVICGNKDKIPLYIGRARVPLDS